MLPMQAVYIEELKFITDELRSAAFSMHCLYLYHSGQLPLRSPCLDDWAGCCWEITRNSLTQHLQDLGDTIGFLEDSLEPSSAPAHGLPVSDSGIPPAHAAHAPAASPDPVHLP